MEFVLEAPGGEKLSARCVCVSLAWLHGEKPNMATVTD